jgi:hypothetical protein
MTIVSCDSFLNIDDPKSLVTRETVFRDDVTATSSLTGIYSSWMSESNSFISGGPSSAAGLSGLSSDELKHYDNDQFLIEFETNSLTSSNTKILNAWGSAYNSIYQANAVVEGLASSPFISAPVRQQLHGEALFIRAFTYFYLVNLFGDVPLITTTDFQENSIKPRSSISEVYKQIKEDLVLAQDMLLVTYPSDGKVRPNKYTVSALLAEVYLYTENWENAEAAATSIIESGEYELEENLNDVFLASTSLNPNTEAIWQLLPVMPGINTFEGYHFLQISSAGLYNKLSPQFVNVFESGDQRLLNWIGSSSGVFYPRKYKVRESLSVTEHKVVFRLAEQYLIRAEARANQANLTEAISDVDIIRERAGLPLVQDTDPNINQTDLLAVIEQERRVELFTEMSHRWFDLKRLNRAENVLGPSKTGWSISDELYPIPLTEIIKNSFLKPQNDGY